MIVTFKPDAELPARVIRIPPHASTIVVIDNGSGLQFSSTLETARQNSGASLMANPENRGQAAALNQGIEFAINHGFKWALLLDQDSIVLPELLSGAQAAYCEFPRREKIAVIGADHDHPFHFKKRNGFQMPAHIERCEP